MGEGKRRLNRYKTVKSGHPVQRPPASSLPAYLLTIIPAPWFRKHGKRPGIAAFVNGITAAAIGAITGAVFVLARGSIVDVTTAVIAVVTVVLIGRFGRRAPEPLIVVVAALLGLALRGG